MTNQSLPNVLSMTSLSLVKSSLTLYMLAEIRSQRWPEKATTTGTTSEVSAISVISLSAVSRLAGNFSCVGSLRTHEGRHHRGWHGQDGGAQGEAEHLLGPVQEGPGVRSQGLATSEAVIELEAGIGADEGCVVHRALHEELVLEAALVQVAGNQ